MRRAERFREQLADACGGRVVFLSHCLLNQNVRCLGGAGRAGGPVAADALDADAVSPEVPVEDEAGPGQVRGAWGTEAPGSRALGLYPWGVYPDIVAEGT